MDIIFITDKLAKEFNNQKLLVRRRGPERAKLIARRMRALRSVVVLEDLRHAPGRWHELGENRAETFAADLDGPYRLIFESADEPLPKKDDGGLDWTQITRVRILGVENYHD